MLMKTFDVFRNLVEYSRTDAGSWKGEFHGAIDVVVEAPSLERCRWDVQEALDEKLAAWIVGPKMVSPKTRHRRSA